MYECNFHNNDIWVNNYMISKLYLVSFLCFIVYVFFLQGKYLCRELLENSSKNRINQSFTVYIGYFMFFL